MDLWISSAYQPVPPRTDWQPTVSVVLTTYNYARYLPEAIDSVLSQDVPRLELIIVDDGSTDDTPQITDAYAAAHPQRIRVIRQPNRGPEAAVNTGIRAAHGELLALLDADDAWLPGKLAHQIAVMAAHPQVGLVFGDALPVDGDGEPWDRPTLGSGIRPIPPRAAARVFFENVALQSTILVRRALVNEIPAEIPIADWWITLGAAMQADIGRLMEPLIRYRMHGANRGSGRHGGDGSRPVLGPHLRDVQFKLGMLRRLDLGQFSPRELAYMWEGVEESAHHVLDIGESAFGSPTAQVGLDPERGAEHLLAADGAAAAGQFEEEARQVIRALAWNPYVRDLRHRLNDTVARAESPDRPRPALPSVSVVVPCHNYGRFLGEALDSVLEQDYPRELVEIIVIDDGSVDDTAEVAARYVTAHPANVRLIRQENRGYVATVNRGIVESGGELLALLDADDAWLPGKLARQVELLTGQPELGLVFGDLVPVDEAGEPFDRPTILASMSVSHPVPRRAAARILYNNEALESTILMRRALAVPVPEELPIADWWLTLQAALVSEIDWVREPVVRYRIHGENMSSGQHAGTGQRQRGSVYVRDILWKLRVLREVDLSSLEPLELAYVWSGVEDTALQTMTAGRSAYALLTPEIDVDPDRAGALLAEAESAAVSGDARREAELIFRSLAWDPYGPGVRARLHDAIKRAATL